MKHLDDVTIVVIMVILYVKPLHESWFIICLSITHD